MWECTISPLPTGLKSKHDMLLLLLLKPVVIFHHHCWRSKWSWQKHLCQDADVEQETTLKCFILLPKYSLFPTLRNICLFSYVRDNNLRQKGPLEAIWSKPLLKARPTLKLHWVAEGYITKVLNGQTAQNLWATCCNVWAPSVLFLSLKVLKVCFKDGYWRLSKDKSVLV